MGGKKILRLDEVDGNGEAWRNADVLSFNTGQWWTHQGSLQGWDHEEFRGKFYRDMDRLAALEIGLKTWANWVDVNIDRSRTKVFFQAFSPTHYKIADSLEHLDATAIYNCLRAYAAIDNTKNVETAKKPNWDLRRDVQKKLDKLERRT
ncbi:hypothetical protein K1719_007157 [Acacia pycnantha]|nr:hypothetical protein K1719_007157 [Acacia pycnantha]